MSNSIDPYFPNWFVFGGYSDPGFKGRPEYNPEAPCDVADIEGDVFTSIPYPVAQKLIAARDEFIDKLQKIYEEYPQLTQRLERKPGL